MRSNRILAGLLVALGFGGVLATESGCGVNRGRKSKSGDRPVADSTALRDGVPTDVPVRVMYGVPPARFEPDKPVREVSGEISAAEEISATPDGAPETPGTPGEIPGTATGTTAGPTETPAAPDSTPAGDDGQ